MTPQAIDWEQLDMISDGFAPDFLEIYQEYLAEIPSLFASLNAALAKADATQAARVAHQIKGSSANFGFTGVSQPVASLELEAKGGSIERASTYLSQAQEGFRNAVAEVKAKRGV